MNTIGTEILGSRYRILRPLGGGGMKSVYLAEDLKLNNRLCAVAAMIDNFANPSEQQAAVAAFQREADMLAALRNEHIPQIYDKFSEQQNHYLVMEFVEGDTLENRIRTMGKLSGLETIDIAIQILDTLEYLHGLKPPVIYRDMKPSNVMILPDGKVKLIDFGIARFFQTSTMTTMGTPGYAPPEQYGGKAEERSDLYALAATIHEALTGRTPVPFDFPPLCELMTGSNQHLSDLLAQALAEKVEERVPNAREFKSRLLAVKSERAAGPQPLPQLVQLQSDRTGSLRTISTQPGGQTWVFNDRTQMPRAACQGSTSAHLSTGRQSSSRNISPSSSLGSSRSLQNNRAAVSSFGAQSAGSGNIAGDEEQTEVLVRGSADCSPAEAAIQGPNSHTWVFKEASGQLPKGRRSIPKILVGLASVAALVGAVAGINQWNEIQHEKALIAAHQAFEQRQQLALQEAERQRETLLQQEAKREAQLRKQQQEAALQRRREWRIRQAQQQEQASYPEGEPAESQGAPDAGVGPAFAKGIAGGMGQVVGETVGQALIGAFSGSAHGRHHR
jgi:serine/threonine protein kinase